MEKTLKGFLDELASSSPTPGGGSVSALNGSIGASLLEMVCSLTIGKEKFKQYEGEVAAAKAEAEALKTKLYDLIEKDARAFDIVMESFKMPKDTDEEKQRRSVAIQQATREATNVPLETAQGCLEILRKIASIVEKVNPNAISDIGVAALCAHSGSEGAALNVYINIPSIKDQSFKENSEKKIEAIRQESKTLREAILEKVEKMVRS